MLITFSHSGNIGDLLASLYYCNAVLKEYGEKEANFICILNTPAEYSPTLCVGPHPCGKYRMTEATVNMIIPILKHISFIKDVTVVTHDEYKKMDTTNHIKLDLFRTFIPNFSAGSITKWYEAIGIPLETEIKDHLALLTVKPNFKHHGKIILTHSKRYFTYYDPAPIFSKFREDIVFIGLPEEYQYMCQALKYELTYQPVVDFYEALEYINGAKVFVSNQTGLFHAVQLILHPRILLPCNACPNVIPNGYGGHTAYTPTHLEKLIRIYYKFNEEESK